MSFRGEEGTLEELLARAEEVLRRLRHTQLEGPVSAGDQAHLARGIVAFDEETADYSGTPTADPYFFLVRVTGVDLKANRVYQAVGVTEVQAHTSTGDRQVRIGKNPVYAATPPSVGEGVTAHTLWGRKPIDSGLAVGDDRDGVVIREWLQASDEDDVEFALIVQSGLEPTGFVDHTIGVYDRGRV